MSQDKSDKPRDSGFRDIRQSLEEGGSSDPQNPQAEARREPNLLDKLTEQFRVRQASPTKSSSESSISVIESDSDTDSDSDSMAPSTSVELDKYTGLAKGAKYPTPPGERTEQFEVRDWCRRVETIAKSANWSQEVTASHAALALVPGSPAENWLRLKQKAGEAGTWLTFKADILDRFSPPVTATQRVAMIRSMRQEKTERVEDFKNRLQLQFECLQEGVDKSIQSIWGTLEDDDPKKEIVDKTSTAAMEYVLQCLFLAGLQDRFVVDITKSGATKLKDMVEVAKRSEVAACPSAGRIASITTEEKAAGATEEEQRPITRSEIKQMIAAMGKTPERKEGKQNRKQKSAEKTRSTDVVCYYCFTKGHTTKACKALTADRRDGIHRATIRDQPMTRSEFAALSYEEKTKGKHMVADVLAEEQNRISTIKARMERERDTTRTVEDLWAGYNLGN